LNMRLLYFPQRVCATVPIGALRDFRRAVVFPACAFEEPYH
jgi:hypothetical protein